MKKSLTTRLFLFFIFLLSAKVIAQRGFYLGLSGGYAAAIDKGEIYNFFTDVNDTQFNDGNLLGVGNFIANKGSLFNFTRNKSGLETTELLNATYGKGTEIRLKAGYMFNKHIGAELAFGYLFGSKIRSSYRDFKTDPNRPHILDITSSAQMLSFTPSFVLSAGLDQKVHPYVKIGPVIGLPRVTSTLQGKFPLLIIYPEIDFESKTTQGVALGIFGSLGLNYSVTEKIGLFGEVQITSLTWKPRKEEIKQYIVNLGIGPKDELGALDFTEFDYEKETSASDAENILERPSHPFSSISANLGVMYNF